MMNEESQRQEGNAERTLERARELNEAGKLAKNQGDLETAQRLHEESLSIRRELGDKRGIAASFNNLGNVAYQQGDYATAEALHTQSLAIKQELGAYTAGSLNNLGLVAMARGDYEAARALFEQALVINQEIGNREWEASNLTDLGSITYHQGDYAAAVALLKQGLAILRELGDKQNISNSLDAFAGMAKAEGQPQRAARLWGAVESLREAVHTPLSPKEQEEYELALAAVRETLGGESFAAAWAEGRAMSMDQAIEYTLKEPSDA